MKEKELTFEEASAKLDEIVSRMEAPDCTLEENIKLYEQAYQMIVVCREKLSQAKTRIVDIREKMNKLDDPDSLFED